MNISNCADEVAVFDEMFIDRFTENDLQFMDLKKKLLSHPTVIFPWKMMQKQWNKKWDYSGGRQTDRDSSRRNEYKQHKQNSRDRYRDRSEDGESSNFRSGRYGMDNLKDQHYSANEHTNLYSDKGDRCYRNQEQNYQRSYNDRH